MPVYRKERTMKSQFGVTATKSSDYTFNDSGHAFAVNQTIYLRFPTAFPPGSTINSANLTLPITAKDLTVTQQSYHLIQAHTSGDSELLRTGVPEYYRRPPTVAFVNWNPTWPANGTDVYSVVPVTAMVQEIVNRSDYQPGGYITFMVTCVDEMGSDMSLWMNNEFQRSPAIEVNYTEPASDSFWLINECENSEFNSGLNGIDGTQPVPYWGQNTFYNTFVDPAVSGGVLAPDTVNVRKAGIPTLRFTCGTPDTDVNKPTGPMTDAMWNVLDPMVFCGWIFLPSYIPTTSLLRVGDPFRSETYDLVVERNQWVRFCTKPLYGIPSDANPFMTRFPAVGLSKFQSGWQFWISEPALLKSATRQEGFNSLSPGKTGIELRPTVSHTQSSRKWTPRTLMLDSGVAKRVRSWSSDVRGIAFPSEKVRGGLQIQQLPAGQTIAGIPAGVTTSEL